MTTLVAHFDGRVLIPDSPVNLPLNQPLKVSVAPMTSLATSADPELDEQVWLQAAVTSSAFDFLKDEAEDIYRPTDGRPFHDEK